MSLLDSGGSMDNVGGVVAETVANMLSQGVQEQIEICRQTTLR